MQKLKIIIIATLALAGLACWNLAEIRSVLHGGNSQTALGIPKDIHLPELQWEWFNQVEVNINEGECVLVKIPPELEKLDGKKVVISGPSFACGDDLVQDATGYTIKGFVMVPYFGMIDCCVGNPIPYFQWTIIVKDLAKDWRINHKGIIDPNVVVQGTLRIQREKTEEGVFFLDHAKVIKSADAQKNSKD